MKWKRRKWSVFKDWKWKIWWKDGIETIRWTKYIKNKKKKERDRGVTTSLGSNWILALVHGGSISMQKFTREWRKRDGGKEKTNKRIYTIYTI